MEKILEQAESYVISYLNEHLDPTFVYHNIAHTQRVVSKTKELIEALDVPEKDTNLLMLAAWFHDVGFSIQCENHEEISADVAEKFLKEQKIDEEDIKIVRSLILVTKMSEEPQTLNEKIIRDADSSHLARKNFSELTQLLRKELELTNNKVYTSAEWIEENVNFLTRHHRYYTEYASINWEKSKSKNLAKLLKTQSKTSIDRAKLKQKKAELSFKKTKIKLPERGIETMFRVTLKNHITLSDIADTKANILLSVNAIIVSLVLSNLVSKLDNASNTYLIWPTVIFVLFTVASMILSVLATRPNVTRGKFTKEDVKNKKVNLLFFGNFHKMKLEEFEWAMGEMMEDRDYLYSSMKKDLYFLGLVLDRKYRILRLTYSVFIIGIIISVIAFAIAFNIQAVA